MHACYVTAAFQGLDSAQARLDSLDYDEAYRLAKEALGLATLGPPPIEVIPTWVYALIIGLVILLGVSVAYSVRLRRRTKT